MNPKINDCNVKKSIVFISIAKFLSQTMLFFWGIYFTQINLSGMEQGILFAIFPLASILLAIPIGLLNDRISARTLIMGGFLSYGLMFYGAAIFQNFEALIAIFLIGALGLTMANLSIDSFFYKTGNKNQHKQISSYVGSYLFAAGLGVLVGGLILDQIDFSTWFKIVGTISLLTTLGALILPQTKGFRYNLAEYKTDIFKRDVFMFMLMIFLWGLHFGSENTSYGLFLKENLGLSYPQMGLYMGISIMAMYLWARLATVLIQKKTPILHILYIGVFMSSIGGFIMIIPRIEISFLGRLIHETGDAFMMVFLYYGIRRLFPKERAGGMTGLNNFLQMSANMVGVLIFAPIGQLYGNEYPILIASGIGILAFPLAYRFAHLIKH